MTKPVVTGSICEQSSSSPEADSALKGEFSSRQSPTHDARSEKQPTLISLPSPDTFLFQTCCPGPGMAGGHT